MGWFNKVLDWPTGKGNEYQKENEAYDETLKEIHAIEDLIECLVTDDTLFEYSEFQNVKIVIRSMKDAIFMYRKRVVNALDKDEREKIKNEIVNLEREYKKLYDEIKELILNSNSISELNQHKMELMAIIKKNARFEAFQNYLNKDLWTMDTLQTLKNDMSKRKVILIPYLGKLR